MERGEANASNKDHPLCYARPPEQHGNHTLWLQVILWQQGEWFLNKLFQSRSARAWENGAHRHFNRVTKGVRP
jgi:hypothetical protein